MYGLGKKGKTLFELQWRGTLSEYITAVAFSPDGKTLAASSAAGDVVLQKSDNLTPLQESRDYSVDCLAFSQDGQYLAAAGQDGRVKIWHTHSLELLTTLDNTPAWVDQLAWSPTTNQLAFSLGRYVQVWDAQAGEIVTTLNFEASSVLGLAWHPIVEHLAIAGYQGVKIWNGEDWDEEPYILAIPSASCAIAWSTNGKYLAAGNLDNTLAVVEWGNPDPWVMRGFPGKVRGLAWSEPETPMGAPLLAAASAEGVVIWEKQADENLGWEGRVLQGHDGIVQAIAFQPRTFLLASAAEEGWLCLWDKTRNLAQTLQATDGFTCLPWDASGTQLAAGVHNGELLMWSQSKRGKGLSHSSR